MSKEKAPRAKMSSHELAEGFVRFGQTASAKSLLPPGAEVQKFEHRDLQSESRPTYSQIRSQFKADVSAKSSRFSLSELVSSQLSVEVEEQRRFEKRVAEEVESRLAILRREASEKAYQEGLEKGRSEAYETEKARLAQQMESMATAVDAVRKARDVLVDGYEKQLVEISFRLSELVVRTQISERPEIIHHTIEAILNRIAREEDVRVRLNAQDFESIEQIRSALEEVSRSGRISFDVDSSLKAGDCVVESSSGEIASFVDDAFAKLKKEMINLVGMKASETGT